MATQISQIPSPPPSPIDGSHLNKNDPLTAQSGSKDDLDLKLIYVKALHPTFCAQVIKGVDFSEPVPPDVFAEIKRAINKYGVLVFRNTSLTNATHVAFSSLFGPLDDVKPYLASGRKNRFAPYDEIFDVSNVEDDGTLAPAGGRRYELSKGNSLFHVDSSFNPRRAGYSLLLAHQLPPKGTGGATWYADTRTAFDELEPEVKEELLSEDYVAAHNLWHSRKKASPDFFADVEPEKYFMSRHRLVQRHEASGRMNLYLANHIHHIEGMEDEGNGFLEDLLKHATQEKYICKVEWENVGDLVIWDNTCAMHRAAGGAYEGVYKRDMRRTTVHDISSQAWGSNEKSDIRMGLP